MATTTARRRRFLAASLAAAGLLATACGSSSKSTSNTTTGSTSAATTAVSGSATSAAGGSTGGSGGPVPGGTLNGAGSTFQLAFDQDAIQAFAKLHSGVTINYGGGGSSTGQTKLGSHLVEFAGTDSIVKDATLASQILYFPTVAGPITVSYNLSGVSKLTLDGPTIAKIYEGQIKTWNDPAIAALNSGVSLPSTPIVPIHRSDGSGTTSNFTKFLTKAAPGVWTLGNGTTVNFPGGQAANGNPGMATLLQHTTGGIAYIDYSTAVASGLKYASVKNSSGNAEAPTLAGASAALDGATVAANLTYDPTNSPSPNAYPITSPTWIITYKTQTDQTKAAILKAFLNYILTTAQTTVAPQDDYAALPSGLAQKAIAQLGQL